MYSLSSFFIQNVSGVVTGGYGLSVEDVSPVTFLLIASTIRLAVVGRSWGSIAWL